MNAFTKIKWPRNTSDKEFDKLHQFISELSIFPSDLAGELVFDEDLRRFIFRKPDEKKGMYFDFQSQMNYHYQSHYSLKNEPLAKACGLLKKRDQEVLDATCGTGKDALLLSAFGAKVTAVERNPLIYFLLLDAVRIFPVPIIFLYGDSLRLIEDFKNHTIYYDPMYPAKKKDALPRKEMQIFKEVIGPDLDSDHFLAECLRIKKGRLVVKRPLASPPLNGLLVHSYKGKSTRYDLY